jgi:hypothetical protein
MSTLPLEVSSLGKSLRSKRRSTRDSLVVAASLRSQISRLGKIGSEFGNVTDLPLGDAVFKSQLCKLCFDSDYFGRRQVIAR